jgi:transposase
MKNIISISVKETLPELEQVHKKCLAETSKRVNMLIALKKNPGISKLQLSGEVNMSLNSIRKWFKHYNTGGLERLLQLMPAGAGNKSTKITPEIHKAIEQWLYNPASSRFADLYSHINITYALGIKSSSFRKYVARHFSKSLKKMKLLQVNVTESFEELESLYKKCSPFIKTRVQMLIVLKKENRISPSDLSRKAGIAYNSAVKWHKIYKQGGLEKLFEVKRGKGRWDKHSVFNFPQEVFDAIENQHIKTPFANYMELFRWTHKNYLPEIKYTQLLKHVHFYFGDKLKIDKSIKLHIAESIEELEDISANSSSRIKMRIRMLLVLKKEENLTFADVARQIKVSYGTVIKWCAIYKKKGINGLLQPNRSSVINGNIHGIVKQKLAQGEFKSFSSLFHWIKQNHLASINYNTFHRYVHRNFKPEMNLMKLVLSVPVTETMEFLKNSEAISPVSFKTRVKMLIEIKQNPAIKMFQLSKMLRTSVITLKKWCALYTHGGIETLLKMGKRGRPKFVMSPQVHSIIENYLARNPDMSIKELYDNIRPMYHGALSYNKLYRYVRSHINKIPSKKEIKSHAA